MLRYAYASSDAELAARLVANRAVAERHSFNPETNQIEPRDDTTVVVLRLRRDGEERRSGRDSGRDSGRAEAGPGFADGDGCGCSVM